MLTKDMKLFVIDIETYLEYFLCGGRLKGTKEILSFHINKWHNDIHRLVKFIEDNPDFYWVGYNSLSFDSQVIEFIVRNKDELINFTNLEICAKIAQFAQDCIDGQKYELRPEYWESSLSTKNIDLMKIHHWDNENNRASLKWLEFMMDMDKVEELPIAWNQKSLTKEECQSVYDYWLNDIDATEDLLLVTLGETDKFSDAIKEVYSGNNLIQDRLDAMDAYGFKKDCLNWSNVKVGDEINLLGYCKLKGIDRTKVYELKKKRKSTKGFTFGDCIPSYVSFKTPKFQEFFKRISKVRVNLTKKEEYPFEYNGTKYMIAKGGIHSEDPRRVLKPLDSEILRDSDIGSQYPNAIFKRKLYPSHLGVEWLIFYGKQILERLENKKKGKDKSLGEDQMRRFKGIAEAQKFSLNGGGFGKTNEMNSWQYDPFVQFSCTIGNQFEVLMLIEMLETQGIRCISANTDGITCLFPKSLEETYNKLCKEWEVIVGNDKQGQLEYADYTMLIQENVNNYIALKKDDKPKLKGRLNHVVPLNKNNTKDITRIQRYAIQQYFWKDIPVKETIQKEQNIFMFVFGQKLTRDYHFRHGNAEMKKMIRYYISPQGEKLVKVKNEDSDAPGAEMTNLVQSNKVIVYNNHVVKPIKDYHIDYDFYIAGAQQVIDSIEGGKKKVKVNINQLNLFA